MDSPTPAAGAESVVRLDLDRGRVYARDVDIRTRGEHARAKLQRAPIFAASSRGVRHVCARCRIRPAVAHRVRIIVRFGDDDH